MPQLWSIWECHNCGYRGPVILEDGNMGQKLQEEWKKKNPQPEPTDEEEDEFEEPD
jgi:hypothetical protein